MSSAIATRDCCSCFFFFFSCAKEGGFRQELTRSAAKALASLIGDKVDGAGRGGLFDERSHGLTAVPAAAAVPSVEEIYRFVRTMYKRTRMQPECVVMVVHYIEKLLRLNAAEVALTAFTWRRLLIAALIVADKVFEDYAVWNADFVSMFPRSDIGDINALEREFLNRIQFGTSVGAGEYAKYYFALRELSEHKDALPAKPLTDAQAKRLETASQQLQDKTAAPKNAKEALPGSFGRSVSLSHFTPDGNFAAPGSSSEN